MMEFFATLSEEDQAKAWDAKKEELADSWFDSYVSENGDELPNYAEEELLKLLGEDFIQRAKDFYEELDKSESSPL